MRSIQIANQAIAVARVTSAQAVHQARMAKDRADLLAEYPCLLTEEQAKSAHKPMPRTMLAAYNMQTLLKRQYQGVKFSVRAEHFSMGSTIHVRWSSGPSESQVEELLRPFLAGRFDGGSDCYEYITSAWHQFGYTKFLSLRRED